MMKIMIEVNKVEIIAHKDCTLLALSWAATHRTFLAKW